MAEAIETKPLEAPKTAETAPLEPALADLGQGTVGLWKYISGVANGFFSPGTWAFIALIYVHHVNVLTTDELVKMRATVMEQNRRIAQSEAVVVLAGSWFQNLTDSINAKSAPK